MLRQHRNIIRAKNTQMRCHHINVRAILKACGQFYTMKNFEKWKNLKSDSRNKDCCNFREYFKVWDRVKKFKNKKNEKKRSKIFFVQNCPLAEKIARTLMRCQLTAHLFMFFCSLRYYDVDATWKNEKVWRWD